MNWWHNCLVAFGTWIKEKIKGNRAIYTANIEATTYTCLKHIADNRMRVRYSPESSCFNGSCDTVKLQRESPHAIVFSRCCANNSVWTMSVCLDILILQTGNNHIGGDIDHSLYIIATIFARLVTSFSLSNSVTNHCTLISVIFIGYTYRYL